MGCYLNPKNVFGTKVSKEEFLENNAQILEKPEWPVKNPRLALVCLVYNVTFTAAAVIYDDREMERVLNPQDNRKKEWYLLPKYMITDKVMDQSEFEFLKVMGFLEGH